MSPPKKAPVPPVEQSDNSRDEQFYNPLTESSDDIDDRVVTGVRILLEHDNHCSVALMMATVPSVPRSYDGRCVLFDIRPCPDMSGYLLIEDNETVQYRDFMNFTDFTVIEAGLTVKQVKALLNRKQRLPYVFNGGHGSRAWCLDMISDMVDEHWIENFVKIELSIWLGDGIVTGAYDRAAALEEEQKAYDTPLGRMLLNYPPMEPPRSLPKP